MLKRTKSHGGHSTASSRTATESQSSFTSSAPPTPCPDYSTATSTSTTSDRRQPRRSSSNVRLREKFDLPQSIAEAREDADADEDDDDEGQSQVETLADRRLPIKLELDKQLDPDDLHIDDVTALQTQPSLVIQEPTPDTLTDGKGNNTGAAVTGGAGNTG